MAISFRSVVAGSNNAGDAAIVDTDAGNVCNRVYGAEILFVAVRRRVPRYTRREEENVT